MKTLWIILIINSFLLISTFVFSQELYIPRDVQQAFRKGTRAPDGKPGKNYWQNSARYTIAINTTPPNREVKGEETIVYKNNSPDTLRLAIIKLFLNIHKPGAPRNRGAHAEYLTSGVHIDAVTHNGISVDWKDHPDRFTVSRLNLPKPLAPKDSMTLTFKWHFDVSIESDREGAIDSTTFFLAYFYPRIAVYDDYNGWDRMSFPETHEFYSDFNDYNVTLTVPKNFIVWGTGTLQHPEELLQPEILKRYNGSFTSNQTIRVATKEDLMAKRITKQNNVNHWQFTAKNIPDVAFAISDHYVWDAASAVVDDKSERRASSQAAYLETSKDFQHMAQYARHSLDWFSHNWPGIPYPYEKTTVVQGYAGMEYPMMANDEAYEDSTFSRFVAEHEIAHTYMPFYMGINETRYGFMDEGWATTFEYLIGITDLGAEKAEEFYKQFRVQGWIGDPGSAEEIPIITPGDALTGPGFGNNEYGKASLGYLALKSLLGDEEFKKCLHAYMDRWNGKHPIPWDFFYTVNDVSGKNLNWFWDSWFFSRSYIDLAIENVKSEKASTLVVINNIGGMPAPFTIDVTYTDESKQSFRQTPVIWATNLKQARVTLKTDKKIKTIRLSGGIWMDADESNNEWTFKK
jgi:hypothetical protein